jgi:hypothetical protein
VLTGTGRREPVPSEVKGEPALAQVQLVGADGDRLLELAELTDPGWTAVAGDGRELPQQSASDWAPAFVAGAEPTTVSLSVRDPLRTWLLWAQLAIVAACVVVALPGRAARDVEVV